MEARFGWREADGVHYGAWVDFADVLVDRMPVAFLTGHFMETRRKGRSGEVPC